MAMTAENAGKPRRESAVDIRELKLLELIHEIGFGEIKVIINDGKPVRIEEMKKSIKL